MSNKSEHLNRFNCGFVSGLLQAGLFNPWDRALYLSVKYNRKFLEISNFQNPFSGLLQTIVQRALSTGLYFPLEDFFKDILIKNNNQSTTAIDNVDTDHNKKMNQFMLLSAGMLAGCMNGIIMNPVTRVKYQYWGLQECGKENFLSTAKAMLRSGGIRPFFLGSMATVARDITFGGVFTTSRYELLPYTKSVFISSLLAGCLGTILSSPINYVRTIHYATPIDQTRKSAYQILKELIIESQNQVTLFSKFSYFQQRLRVGWGTARVGCGMAFAASVYDHCVKQVN